FALALAPCLPPLCGRREARRRAAPTQSRQALRPSLVQLRLTPYDCGSHPGVGHQAPPAVWQAGLRPTSDCPCPCSPRNICLGSFSLQRHAWSARRGARSGGVSHPLARVESPSQCVLSPAVRREKGGCIAYLLLAYLSDRGHVTFFCLVFCGF